MCPPDRGPVVHATNPYLFVFQGSWNELMHRVYGGSYPALVKDVALFGTCFISNAAEWGTPDFPHTVPFQSLYKPASARLDIPGITTRQLFADLKMERPECRLFPYSCIVLDHVEHEWDAGGYPPQVPWTQAYGCPNLFASLYAIEAQVGADNYDGIFLDLCGSTYLTPVQYANGVSAVKAFNKYVAANVMFPYVSNAEFALKSPWMGVGDYVFVEGLGYDSVYGDLRKESIELCKFMSGKLVPLAWTQEAPRYTTPAQMWEQPEIGRWQETHNLALVHLRQPGLMPVGGHTNYEYTHKPFVEGG